MLLHAQALPDGARRPLVLLAIAGLHVLLIAALANGFAQRVFSVVTHPTVAVIIDQRRPLPRPADPPSVSIDQIRVTAVVPPVDPPPPPLDPPPADIGTGPTSISEAPPIRQTGGGVTVPAPIVLLGRNQLPDTEDYYPPASRRRGEEGSAQARACVNEGGRLATAPQLISSSGHRLLDEAALEVLRAGHYARATQAGAPIANCYDFRITFRFR